MIHRRRRRPAAGLAVQVDQEMRGIGRVGDRVEGLLQGRERIRVVQQVHLHAADIDRTNAARLQRLHRGDRLGLALKNVIHTLRVDRPRPGIDAAVRLAPAALHPADRGHELGGNAGGALGGTDGGAALQAGAGISGHLGAGGGGEQAEQRGGQGKTHGGSLGARARVKRGG